jgi:hypothetical protein
MSGAELMALLTKVRATRNRLAHRGYHREGSHDTVIVKFTERCGSEPCVEVLRKGQDGLSRFAAETPHGKAEVALVALDGAHTTPHIAGNFLPRIQDRSLGI